MWHREGGAVLGIGPIEVPRAVARLRLCFRRDRGRTARPLDLRRGGHGGDETVEGGDEWRRQARELWPSRSEKDATRNDESNEVLSPDNS